jgi:hypothetical protein
MDDSRDNPPPGGRFGRTRGSSHYHHWTADFDGDGHPDFLLYNFNTRETAIDYLSNNVLVNAAMGPTLPFGWVFPF